MSDIKDLVPANDTQKVIREYLRDAGGAPLELSAAQRDRIDSLMATSSFGDEYTQKLIDMGAPASAVLSNQITASNLALSRQMAASTEAIVREVASVNNTVVEGFAVTMAKLDQIDQNLAAVNQGVLAVDTKANAIAQALLSLSSSFYAYVDEDRKVQAIQQATSDISNVNLELDRRFRSHDKIRANSVGILRARDLGVVRTDTIITETEKNLLNASNYWLAPALIALAHWIDSAAGDKEHIAFRNAQTALSEAFRLDRQKTSLMFGLVNLRANRREEAAQWFGKYLEFQQASKVDHTMMLLLNVLASGVLEGTAAGDTVVRQFRSWLDEIDDSDDRDDIIRYWERNSLAQCAMAPIQQNRFSAIKACSPESYDGMMISLQGAYLHDITRKDLEEKLARRDINEEETWAQIDDMLIALVSSFDGEELPLRRQYEFHKLIIDLNGNVKLANGLRSIKDEVLSETKRFIDVMNHAAADAQLANASAATSNMAIRLEMPWIKEGYKSAAEWADGHKPEIVPIHLGDFNAQTTDGNNENEIVTAFQQHVANQEREQMAAAAATPLHMALAIIGGAVAVLSLILCMVGITSMSFLLVPAAGCAIYGIMKIVRARKAQEDVVKQCALKLRNGVLALRELCAQVRTWTQDYTTHMADATTTEAYMDSIIRESVEAAAMAAAHR